jgi:TonB family protein
LLELLGGLDCRVMSRVGLFVFLAASSAIAQNFSTPRVIVSKLSPPTYPRLALQARIAGSVEMNIAVRPDGNVESIALVSGHPMLKSTAIESAQKTQFECKDCREPSMLYHMTYKFELGDALGCKGIDADGYDIYDASGGAQVTQTQAVVTIRGRPYATCDPTEKISFLKFRSAKCLYLWRCGKRQLQ